jgi:hypothetical protein
MSSWKELKHFCEKMDGKCTEIQTIIFQKT